MKTPELNQLLRDRYSAPSHAILFEVANGTGAHGTRSCDAVAMSLYPSRGLELLGFEIKASRSDWLRELKKPEKTEESVYRFMDAWYVVAVEGIVKPGELPSTWGLIETRKGKLFAVQPAPVLKPKPITREFLAALMRRASEAVESPNADAFAAVRTQGFQAGFDAGKKQAENQSRAGELRQAIDAFEQASGVRIGTWDAGIIGAAVRSVLAGDHVMIRDGIGRIKNTALDVARRCEAALEEKA